MPDLRRPSSRTALAILATLVVAGCGGAAPPASGPPSTASSAAPSLGQTRTDASGIAQVWVSAGGFRMGTDAADYPRARWRPARPTGSRSRSRASNPPTTSRSRRATGSTPTEVTNAAFQAFKDAGGYTTEALWSPDGWTWLGQQDRGRACRSTARATSRSTRGCASPGSRRRPTRPGAAAGSRPRPNGSTRRAARSRRSTRGATRSIATKANVVDSVGPEAGRELSDGRQLGRRLRHVRQRDGVGRRLARRRLLRDEPGRRDPTGPATGKVKVEKGGWWGSNAFVARSAYRHYEDPPTYGDKHIGFRVVSPDR